MQQYFGKYPATIASYASATRKVTVHVAGLTDGSESGLPATFCLPIGENDRDSEILINVGDEVWVEFEKGDPAAPIIVGYRTHTTDVVVGIRRIRQKNIELVADDSLTIKVGGCTMVWTPDGPVSNRVIEAPDFKSGTVTLKVHIHPYTDNGTQLLTGQPQGV